MSKIFFCSSESSGGDLALRIGLEGNKVKYYVHDAKTEEHNLEGLIEKSNNWRKEVGTSDFVILDSSGMSDVTNFILKSGRPAFGMARKDGKIGKQIIKAHEFHTTIEKDRNLAKELMKSLKIGEKTESLEFKDIPSALEHLKSHRVAHAIKPEMTGIDSQHTYVGEKENGMDSIGWLETLPDRPEIGKIKRIEIEEKIQGVEVACSIWFNGKDFIGPPNINFEHKKIAAGGLGFNTGEMGTLMFYDCHGDRNDKLFMETIYKMGDILADFDYRGQLDINCIVNKDGIFPLEFTPRLGYPSIYIEQELHESPWGDFMGAIASGSKFDLKVSDKWAIGALLVGEGFPFWKEGHKRVDGLPIFGLTEENIKHFHMYNTIFKDNRFLASGCLPLIATSTGESIKKSQEYLYDKIIPQVFFPGMYYRNDIGNRTESDIVKLKEFGYEFGSAV